MAIYTRKGDFGKTCLLGNVSIGKTNRLLDVIGTIDELNASIGLALGLLDAEKNYEIIVDVQKVQKNLMALNSNLAATYAQKKKLDIKLPDYPGPKDIKWLEKSIDRFDRELPKLTNFILPGGHPSAGAFQLSRAICRRAERLLIKTNSNQIYKKYLNRLSDYLFTIARVINTRSDFIEEIWKS